MFKRSQHAFVQELSDECGTEFGKSVPLSAGTRLAESEFDEIGAPGDSSNGVGVMAGYCAAPKFVHWRAALGILGYARWTSSLEITFQRGSLGELSLQAFADADYPSKATDRRPVSRRLVMCGGACVSRLSMTQKCITRSTTNAEYVALGDIVKEVLLLRRVLAFYMA